MNIPKFKITQGIIHINSIDVMQCTEDTLVFSIDCRQKRPCYKGETGDPCFGFYVGANEDTLHVDDPNSPDTKILIEGWGGKGDFWTFVEPGKYYIRFAIVRIGQMAQFIEDDHFKDGSF